MNNLLPTNWLTLPPETLANIAPIEQLNWKKANDLGIKVSIKREDLIDPIIGGNKIYKLYGHLQHYLKQPEKASQNQAAYSKQPIASFGGAYSNHLYALAGACQELNIPLIAIIRGEKPPQLSPTLLDIQAMGTRLHFISRQNYKKKDDPTYLAELEKTFGSCFWIPEGGGGTHALIGCEALGKALAQTSATTIVHACGTGASLAGIINGVGMHNNLHPNGQSENKLTTRTIDILGISVLKSNASIVKNIVTLANTSHTKKVNWRISNQFHLGGYAKKNTRLINFIAETATQLNIPLDPIYTAKAMLAIDELLDNRIWQGGDHIMLVHSGGLQGAR